MHNFPKTETENYFFVSWHFAQEKYRSVFYVLFKSEHTQFSKKILQGRDARA